MDSQCFRSATNFSSCFCSVLFNSAQSCSVLLNSAQTCAVLIIFSHNNRRVPEPRQTNPLYGPPFVRPLCVSFWCAWITDRIFCRRMPHLDPGFATKHDCTCTQPFSKAAARISGGRWGLGQVEQYDGQCEMTRELREMNRSKQSCRCPLQADSTVLSLGARSLICGFFIICAQFHQKNSDSALVKKRDHSTGTLSVNNTMNRYSPVLVKISEKMSFMLTLHLCISAAPSTGNRWQNYLIVVDLFFFGTFLWVFRQSVIVWFILILPYISNRFCRGISWSNTQFTTRTRKVHYL